MKNRDIIFCVVLVFTTFIGLFLFINSLLFTGWFWSGAVLFVLSPILYSIVMKKYKKSKSPFPPNFKVGEDKFWMLTIQKKGNFSTETIFHKGSIAELFIYEHVRNREFSVVWSTEITENEYIEYHSYLRAKS